MARKLNLCFLSFILITSLAPYARSTNWFLYNGLCNKTFADANSTGVFPFRTELGGEYTRAGWAITVLEKNTSIQATRWFSPAGLDYSNDFELAFDVCALEIEAVNDLARYRARSDDGSCVQTLGQSCITALTKIALSRANELTDLHGPNLTTSALPTVCQDVANAISDNFPKECKPYYEDLSIYGFQALTDHADVNARGCCGEFVKSSEGCSINQSATYTWYPVAEEPSYKGLQNHYEFYGRQVFPTMNLFIPVVNQYARNFISLAHSHMTCLRVNHFNPESEVVSPQPSPPPRPYRGLGGGDIAGITVGCVLGIALITGLTFWLWRRKTKHKGSRQATELDGSGNEVIQSESESRQIVEASPDTAISEANIDWGFMRATSGGEQMAELPTTYNKINKPRIHEKSDHSTGNVHEIADSRR